MRGVLFALYIKSQKFQSIKRAQLLVAGLSCSVGHSIFRNAQLFVQNKINKLALINKMQCPDYEIQIMHNIIHDPQNIQKHLLQLREYYPYQGQGSRPPYLELQ